MKEITEIVKKALGKELDVSEENIHIVENNDSYIEIIISNYSVALGGYTCERFFRYHKSAEYICLIINLDGIGINPLDAMRVEKANETIRKELKNI